MAIAQIPTPCHHVPGGVAGHKGRDVADLVELTNRVLVPIVGNQATDACVRATAFSAGKTTAELTCDDLGFLESSIRDLLGPVAPAQMIDAILADVRQEALL